MKVEPTSIPEDNKPNKEVGHVRFNLKNLLWFTSLIAIGLGTFGPFLGATLIIASLVLVRVLYNWILSDNPVGIAIKTVVILLIAVSISLWLLLPRVGSRPASKRNQSINNMKQIMLAMHNYHDVNRHWPEPFTVDKNGNRLHSWRTLLLPYMGEQTFYEMLDLEASWKEANNSKWLKDCIMIDLLSPRSDSWQQDKPLTNYLAVVDDEAVFSPNSTITFRDITDGSSKTIVSLEVFNQEIAWYEPRDLTIDEAVNILTGKDDADNIREGFFYSRRVKGGWLSRRTVGFADGFVGAISTIDDPAVARALLTRAGGEELPDDWDDFKPEVTTGIIIHWGRCFSTLLYIALALLPVFNAFRKKSDSSNVI